VNASFRLQPGKNFLAKTRVARENLTSERFREGKSVHQPKPTTRNNPTEGRELARAKRSQARCCDCGKYLSPTWVSRRVYLLKRAKKIFFEQKKRPLKRAGVKPLGAKLYKRFLAGGIATVVVHPPKTRQI
jgi:hypothetical protein